ncbi:MAG TPA: gluconate 2-dehydrogenase subunit 3 family protein [Gemmatimonadales bacterium]|nr:gluconate 2-dehydrogenase subunit 3 family protein [Gemmatimonadales bacterium]
MLNARNQVWDAPNVFVTDGACMTSASCVNPSLTYMALTAPAADFAVNELKRHRRDDDAPAHYFRLMKQLTLLGYFTSEIGCTQAMRYRETPGRFDPCVPYRPGETTWAGHA